MSNKSIVDAWLEVELDNGAANQAEAIASLNDALGTKHSASRIGEWRNNKRPIPRPTRLYMLKCGISVILRKAGINTLKMTDEQLDKLAEILA